MLTDLNVYLDLSHVSIFDSYLIQTVSITTELQGLYSSWPPKPCAKLPVFSKF